MAAKKKTTRRRTRQGYREVSLKKLRDVLEFVMEAKYQTGMVLKLRAQKEDAAADIIQETAERNLDSAARLLQSLAL